MRALFIFPNAPLDASYAGGASRYVNSYHGLLRLGYDVHVIRFLEQGPRRDRVEAFERSGTPCRESAASWRDITYDIPRQSRCELLWDSVANHPRAAFPMIDSLARILEEEQERVRPEFSWVEWGLCGAVMARSRPRQPWVYAHHDWAHRLAGVRAKISGRAPPLSDRLCEYNMQKTEHWIARQATAVVSGSATEAREMEMIGCSNCYVIPTAYEAAPPPGFSARPLLPLRIVHLGALSTTANYAGLQSYLTKVHPMVQEEFAKNKLQPPELSIIGDTSRAKPKLLDQLRAAGATIHGHVTDLSTVLRPFDVAIIPYEQNTGTRTKLSLLFNHAQMVLATAQSVAGSKEIQPGENCLVVSDLSEFPRALLEVARNGSYREALGRAARALFEERFTYAAQQPLFAQVLQSLNPDPVRSSAELCQI